MLSPLGRFESVRAPAGIIPYLRDGSFERRSPRHFVPGYDHAVPLGRFGRFESVRAPAGIIPYPAGRLFWAAQLAPMGFCLGLHSMEPPEAEGAAEERLIALLPRFRISRRESSTA